MSNDDYLKCRFIKERIIEYNGKIQRYFIGRVIECKEGVVLRRFFQKDDIIRCKESKAKLINVLNDTFLVKRTYAVRIDEATTKNFYERGENENNKK